MCGIFRIVCAQPDRLPGGFLATVAALDAFRNVVTNFTGPVELSARLEFPDVDLDSSTTASPYPLASYFHDSRTQVIYPSSEVGGSCWFTALSLDEGRTWGHYKLVSCGAARSLGSADFILHFTMDATHAEPAGYLTAVQTPDNVVHLISSRDSNEAVETVTDPGAPFDPLTYQQKPRPQTLAEAEPGGPGIMMMRDAADSISYRYGEGRNCLAFRVGWATPVDERDQGAARQCHISGTLR